MGSIAFGWLAGPRSGRERPAAQRQGDDARELARHVLQRVVIEDDPVRAAQSRFCGHARRTSERGPPRIADEIEVPCDLDPWATRWRVEMLGHTACGAHRGLTIPAGAQTQAQPQHRHTASVGTGLSSVNQVKPQILRRGNPRRCVNLKSDACRPPLKSGTGMLHLHSLVSHVLRVIPMCAINSIGGYRPALHRPSNPLELVDAPTGHSPDRRPMASRHAAGCRA